jgi:3-oxoacyl-(acyl-carrier-protein) synthase
MSEIVWSRSLLPQETPRTIRYGVYADALCVPRACAFPQKDEELVTLPDPRAYRSMNRASLLLAAAALPANEVLGPRLRQDPFGVGLYCAVENGPPDYDCAKVIAHTPPEEFALSYKRNLRSAKQYLRQLPNLTAAQLAIFLGLMGPIVVFTHSTFGASHALDQAEHDLETGVVRAALVAAAFSLEDPLMSMRVRRDLDPGQVLSEGAAAVVLEPSGRSAGWKRQATREAASVSCAIAQPLVAVALDRPREHAAPAPVR